MTVADILRLHIDDDVYELSVKEKWFEQYDKSWLIQQIQSRQKAKSKLPTWYGNFDLIFPPPISVEQASSEATAAYKASLVYGENIVDMTGGMGIDSVAFSFRFKQVFFFEMHPLLAEVAAKNFHLIERDNIVVQAADSVQMLPSLPPVDWVYLDPSRRQQQRKVFLLENCTPSIVALLPLLKQKCPHILLKLSPMFEISAAIQKIEQISDIHIVAVHNEVKELLIVWHRDTSEEQFPMIHCVNLEPKGENTIRQYAYPLRNTEIKLSTEVGHFLYEPHPVLCKAGMMDAEAQKFNLSKLQKNSQLYTSNTLYKDFFGRIFQVESIFGFSKSELKQGLKGMAKANITIRNFPMSEVTLRKKLKLADGGDITLFATTLQNGKHILIRCHKANLSSNECNI